jgi:hypothetical protein
MSIGDLTSDDEGAVRGAEAAAMEAPAAVAAQVGDASIAFRGSSRQFADSSQGVMTMRYTTLFIATCVTLAATLVMAIHPTTGPATASEPPYCGPYRTPKCVKYAKPNRHAQHVSAGNQS